MYLHNMYVRIVCCMLERRSTPALCAQTYIYTENI